MVVYRSAYQRFFKGPDWDDYSKEEYRSKAKYRSDRRSVEHQHHVWFWDSEIEEDDVEEIVDKERHVRDHAQVPTVREKEGGNRRSREAWSDKRGAQREKVVEERKQVDDKNQQQVREEEDPKENSKKQQRHRQELGEKHRKSSEKRRKHRSSSESPSRNFKEKQRQPPFVAYGWANDGTVDKKRTHNILASSAEVYPAALRAAKRREIDIKKKIQKHEEAIKNKEIPTLHESVDTEYPKSMWLTEYQQNFCRDNDVKRHFLR